MLAIFLLLILSSPLWAAELCHLEPMGDSGWHYRTKVGGRPERCYYVGERMKPRSELYWAETPAIPPPMAPPKASDGEFELRWKGETR